MTNIEMYAMLVDIINKDNSILSYFLKAKIKKQVLANIETSIIRLFKKREYFRISGDDRRVKQITKAFVLLTDFRDEVKNAKL